MATPATLFRPLTVPIDTAVDLALIVTPGTVTRDETAIPVRETRAQPALADAGAMTWTVLVPPSGSVHVVNAQTLWLGRMLAGRRVTLWADDRSLHAVLDGHHLKTVASRLSLENLGELSRRGALPGGPAPAQPALPRDRDGRTRLPPGRSVEIDRTVGRDGVVRVEGHLFTVAVGLVGQRIILRLDGQLMHAIAAGTVVKTWPMVLATDRLTSLSGARIAATTLPAPAPAGSVSAQRRVPTDGVVMIASQRLRIGRSHAGKLITIVADDNYFRVLDGDQELATHVRTTDRPITRFKAWSQAPKP